MSRWADRVSTTKSTRPRACRAAAERLIAEGGPAALSVRAVAEAANTTTRAVYALFGSKEALFVDALAHEAFDFLVAAITDLVETDDPVSDLIDVGVHAFRRLILEHPALYRIAFQRVVPGLRAGPELTERARGRGTNCAAKLSGSTMRDCWDTNRCATPPWSSTR